MNQANHGVRVDKWLQTEYNIPYSLANKLVRLGRVTVNGERVKGEYKIKESDSVEIKANIVPGEEKIKTKPSPAMYSNLLKLIIENIVFMDEQLLVINKPFGVAVQGGNKIKISLDDILGELKFDCSEKPRLAHRIDQHTSGLLILARTRDVAQDLGKLFQEHEIEKKYIAVLVGVPSTKSGTIKSYMEKFGSRGEKEKMHNVESGREAITRYKVLKTLPHNLCMVEFKPLTGRTHQIRVHAAINLNCPILGDAKYGGRQEISHDKLHLHASEIEIQNLGKKHYHLKADLPKHMLDTIERQENHLHQGTSRR